MKRIILTGFLCALAPEILVAQDDPAQGADEPSQSAATVDPYRENLGTVRFDVSCSDAPLVEDHIPRWEEEGTHQYRARAYALGYIRALIDAVKRGH